MSKIKQKLQFNFQKAINKIAKPQITTIITTYIDGVPTSKFYGKSLVANFLQWIYVMFADNDADFATSGAPFNSRAFCKTLANGNWNGLQGNVPHINADATEDDIGLVIGTGNTAPTPADYALETQIVDGNGAGEMEHGTQTANLGVNISGSESSFNLRREFVNNSGGSITINEVALYGEYVATGGMWYRDVISGGDTVPDGSTYRVDLTFTITT